MRSREHLEEIKEKLKNVATDSSIKLEKFKDTGNLAYIGFSVEQIYLKVDINYKVGKINPVAKRFEKVDGTYTDILTLAPENLILEKINAYNDRRFIRDIYDIYILSNYVQNKDEIKRDVTVFVSGLKPPINEEDLKALIYEGTVPSFKSMTEHIKGVFL